MAAQICVNIGFKGMACCFMAPSHYQNQISLIIERFSVAFTWEQFHKNCSYVSLNLDGLKENRVPV